MSAVPESNEQLPEGETVTVPTHDIEVRDGGERVRLKWWHGSRGRVRARALFRVVTDDGVIVLTALSAWPLSQQNVDAPTWDVTLDNIPDGLLLALRGAGYTPTKEDL